MGEKLSHYLPEGKPIARVELREELAPVVIRIGEILPPGVVWELFSSPPKETGGRIIFPYCRVDKEVIGARDCLYSLETFDKRSEKDEWWYNRASRQVFKALMWVEVGFEGLKNLAESRASVNWTSAVGHTVSDEERAVKIMTTGREMYEKYLRRFTSFRQANEITEDYFSQYGVEYLLDEFK